YFPLSASQRWVAFSDDGREVTSREVSLPTGALDSVTAQANLSVLLLEPFRPRILAARRLVVLPYGRLRTVDFQALPFGGDGKILLSERPVAYGLDISDGAQERPSGLRRGIVVADSRGDLPEARKEGRDAQAKLRAVP